MKKTFLLFLVLGVVGYLGFAHKVSAYRIEAPSWITVENDFVLGPGKTEVWVDPGEVVKKDLTITNRTGKTTGFKIDIEDFRGSRDPEQTVVLLGQTKGPYSLRDWLKPEITEFDLKQGEQMTLSIEVLVPADVEPGGHYGAIVVSTKPSAEQIAAEKGKVTGGVKVQSRIGALFFVRVKGNVNENGALKDFKITGGKNFFEKGPINFEILYENNGSVHLVPYGIIEIKNILGKKIDEIEIDPYFAMPDSLRLRDVKWERSFLCGKYTASLSLNRGYKDIIDQMSLSFWVIPWKIILVVFLALVLVIWFFIWALGHFEVRKRGPEKNG
jgi:hypothetical protein